MWIRCAFAAWEDGHEDHLRGGTLFLRSCDDGWLPFEPTPGRGESHRVLVLTEWDPPASNDSLLDLRQMTVSDGASIELIFFKGLQIVLDGLARNNIRFTWPLG